MRLPLRRQEILVLPLILMGLSGCGWFPLFKPKEPSTIDLFQLEEESKREASIQKRSATQKTPMQPHSKQITTASPSRVQLAPVAMTLETATACIRSTGIPAENTVAADPTNYGNREQTDDQGKPVHHIPRLIVLHETVASEKETLNLFRTRHDNESEQSSYHMVIAQDGRRIRTVNDDYRAYGAGDSAFSNYTIRLKKGSDGSLNNIALHVSLVSPEDGRGDNTTHSGYTKYQYASAAAQVLIWQATYGIPFEFLTTHKAIDRSNTRKDPRSFDWRIFGAAYRHLSVSCGLQAYGARR
jgi:N-acetyl-anhydromuramyl-L-alanine amidase AmpD